MQKDGFPEDILNDPVVRRVKVGNVPVMGIGLSSKTLTYGEQRKEAMKLEKGLKRVPGVSRLLRYGFREREIRIEVSPKKLLDYQLSLQIISSAIKNRNVQSTSGTLKSYVGGRDIVTLAQFRSPKEVENVIVRTTFMSPAVRVKDVAVVKDDFEDEKTRARINGNGVILYSVFIKDNADITRTFDKIKKRIDNKKFGLKDSVKLTIAVDNSKYVKDSYGVVVNNGVMGLILVIVILTIMLRFRISIWVAVGIPVSILGALALLPQFGFYMNVITVSSLILVIGIIVDDSIIIGESIYQCWEDGDTPLEAAVNGVSRVFWPVLTTVITTFLAFFPMFLIPGSLGKFIMVIPLVITLAITLSLVEAIVALPSHISRSLKGDRQKKRYDFFNKVKDLFERYLEVLLRYRYILSSIFVVLLIGSLVLGSIFLKIFLFPTSGADYMTIDFETEIGTSLDATSNRVREIEKILAKMPKKDVLSYTSIIGRKGKSFEQENYATISLYLTPYSSRDRVADEIAEDLKKKFRSVKGFRKILFNVQASAPNPRKNISMRIVGSDEKKRTELTDKVFEHLKSIKGVDSVDRDDDKGKDQMQMRLNYELLSRAGLSVSDISRNLRTAFEGQDVTKVQYSDEEVNFRIRFALDKERSDKILNSIHIPNLQGQLVPLKRLAKFKSGKGKSIIRHYQGQRSVTIEANVDKKIISSKAINKGIVRKFDKLLQGGDVRILFRGESEEVSDSVKQFIRVFIISILGIYFLLMLLFASPLQPLLVMAAIPFGITGVILTFIFHGEPLSFFAILGIVGLSGVVVNDSLVLVYSLNGIMKDRKDEPLFKLIAKGAANRLRPVVLTTLTTTAGVLPLAYGIGGDNPVNAPMALALGWGLLFATPLSLVLVPCLYAITYDLKRIKTGISHKISPLVNRIMFFREKRSV
ncbi:efflux RND transporter permease subunit [Spirochaetota bacterium]